MKKTLWISGVLAILAILGTGYFARPDSGAADQPDEKPPHTPTTAAAPDVSTDHAVALPPIDAEISTLTQPHAADSTCPGCAQHDTHASASGSMKQERPSLMLTASIRQKLFNVGKDSPMTFALPGDRTATGTVEMIRQENGRTVMVQGPLSAPREGRFFFQLQSMPGGAGSMVGVVTLEDSDVAYSVEPGLDGTPELREKHADDVFCRNYSAIPQPEDIPEEIPADHPDDIAIPGYQNGVIPLSSLPGALGVVYLDFDGEEGPHAGWSDLDAEPHNLSSADIKYMWELVAEEFAPFNINVTTDLQVYLDAPENSRQRCVITKTSAIHPGAGGVAYVNSFNWTGDTPCWCFYHGRAGALVIAHEVGHTLGLSHDGRTTPSEGYYGGHSTAAGHWGPIMGAPYSASITHWSKGEYLNANQTQDDLAIIDSKNNVALRTDDHGDTMATATLLEIHPDDSVNSKGVIETDTDSDGFKFTLKASGSVSLTVNTAAPGPNLDVLAELVDSNNTVVATANPDDALTATVGATLAAGDYFLRITGEALGDPLSGGFSSYGSLGFYNVTGTVPNAVQPDRFAVEENSANGTAVGTVSPRNSHGADPITFAISAGNSNGAFALTPEGELTVADSVLFDYEALSTNYDDPATFELFVDITNTNTPALNETVRVVVEVTNINEAPAINGNELLTLLEHTQIGTEVLQATGSDPDPYDFVTYSISAGNTDNAFAIDADTGLLTVASDIDASLNPSYSLTIAVTDQGTPGLTASTNVAITLVAIAPGYTPGTITHTYFEGISGGSVSDLIGDSSFPNSPDTVIERATVEAGSYGDSYGSSFRGYVIPPVSGSYTFWVASDDGSELYLSTDADPANMSKIASVSGWTDKNDWDDQSSQQSAIIVLTAGQPYYLEIRHKEGGGGDHISAAWQGPGITRQVISGLYTAPYRPNYAPSVVETTYDISEEAYIGTVVGTAVAFDHNDSDTHHAFTLIGGNINDAFSIDPVTGIITVADTSRLIAGDAFNLQVQVTDDGTPVYNGSGIITVNITTADARVAGILTQEIWSGIAGNPISALTGHPNYPNSPSYTRTLTSFDSGTDIENEYGSRIRAYVIPPTTGSYTFYISSDDHSQLLLSTDSNATNAALIASISDWTDHNQWDKFSSQQAIPVSLTAGQIYYIETLHKEGGGGDHLSVGWTGPDFAAVTVIDGAYLEGYSPNAAPLWDAAPYTFSAVNTDPDGTVVGTVSATDDSADALLYNILSGNESGGFAIDPTTGTITIANHFGLNPGQYILQVGVQDAGSGTYPSNSDTTDITITISGSNAPVVNDGAFSLYENIPAESAVGTVEASDADAGNTLTYAISGGNGDGHFTIDTNSGTIATTAPLNYEVLNLYTLTVQATDNDGFYGIGTITINVTDLDESAYGGVVAWEEQVHTGTTYLHKRTQTLPGNEIATIDLSTISGNATFEFIVHGKDFGQTWGRLLTGNNWTLNLETWHNTGRLGVTQLGVADYAATAESGQSASTPYGAPVHVVFSINATGQTKIYVNGLWVASNSQSPVLTDALAYIGSENVRNDSSPGILAFAAYNTLMGDAEISTHYHAWFDTLFVDSDSDTLDDNWEIAQYGAIGTYNATDNPDGDRLNMYEEMVFGGGATINNPTSDFVIHTITNDAGIPNMVFSYRRARNYHQLNVGYQLQTAALLESSNWTNNPSAPDSIVADPDGYSEWVTHILPILEEDPLQFYRCIVTPQ